MQEYKNKIVVEPREEVYNKSKIISVENLAKNCEKVFFNIKGTINYCETQGVKVDRKSIKKSIINNEAHEGFIFKQKRHQDKYVRKHFTLGYLILCSLFFFLPNTVLVLGIFCLFIVAINFLDTAGLSEGYELNGNMLEDFTIIPDAILEEINKTSDLPDTELNNILEVSRPEIQFENNV